MIPDIAYITLALVPGIGRARLDALLHAFGSPHDVLQATPRALEAVPGISARDAQTIRGFFDAAEAGAASEDATREG